MSLEIVIQWRVRLYVARGLSYVQVDKHGITSLYHLPYASVDLAHHRIVRAKAGKGCINIFILTDYS